MPRKHRIKGTIITHSEAARPTRFAFSGRTVTYKDGKLYRERLGFKGNKVVEIALVPTRK